MSFDVPERRRGPWPATSGFHGFPSTRWSLVQDAAREGTLAASALGALCEVYWYPLYVFVRRSGHDPHDSRDLTQGFFEHLIAGNHLARADHERGRLRSYLLGGIKHYMAAEWRRQTRKKRGGGEGALPILIDEEKAEDRLRCDPVDRALTPDREFDRRWALLILDRVLEKLGAEYGQGNRSQLFEVLSPYLSWNEGGGTYGEAGAVLGMREGAVKVAVHRMRRRYGELLRAEIVETVASPTEIREELDALIDALR